MDSSIKKVNYDYYVSLRESHTNSYLIFDMERFELEVLHLT